MKKKLLFVNPCADIGGAEMSLLLLLNDLDQIKYELNLLLPEEGVVADRARTIGVHVHTMRMHSMMIERDVGRSLKDSLIAAPEINKYKRFLQHQQVDLVHINSYRVGIPFSLAARRLQIPTVWHMRDIPESAWKKKLVATAARLPTQVVTISQAVTQAIGLQENKNVEMVYNAVEMDAFTRTTPGLFRQELNLPDETVLLCSIGQLIPWKGHDQLIKAFARMVDGTRYHLVIVGGNVSPIWAGPETYRQYPQQLRDMVSYYELEDRITFTGFRQDVPQILTDIDLYVHTAVAPEPFGRVLVEAMAACKPVIAPAWGGIPEIVVENETGWLFPPRDNDALVACLQTAVNTPPEKLAAMGQAGRRRAQTMFTAQQHVAAMDKIFSRLLAL